MFYKKMEAGRIWTKIKPTCLMIILLSTASITAETMYQFGKASEGLKLTEDVINGTVLLELALVDAETGQRGYIITGNSGYLDVYHAGVAQFQSRLGELMALTTGEPALQRQVAEISSIAPPKLSELARTLVLREQSFGAARDEVTTHLGKNLMDDFRRKVQVFISNQERVADSFQRVIRESAAWASASLVASISLLFAYFMSVVTRHIP